MLDYQERVVTEKADLDEKLSKLSEFVENDIFSNLPKVEQELLSTQLNVMKKYSGLLGKRITLFREKSDAE